MAENFQSEKHYDFSGAVNQYVGSLLKADNELNALENGYLDTFGPVKKGKGYEQRGEDVNTGYTILGGVAAYKSDGSQKQIVIADGPSNSDAYTFNVTNQQWTPHLLSLTTGAKAQFENFLDGFFMVNFDDATRWNNLSSWSTTTNVTNAPKAKYIKLYLSRLYLGYVAYDGTTFPSRVVYSDLPAGPPYTLSWTNETNWFDVNPEDGDVIKGLAESANRLLVFKENALYRYDTNTLYKVPGCPGTVNNRTIQNLQGWTIYLHSSGIWAYDGSTSKLISRPIKDIIEGISTINYANATSWVVGDHYYLFVGDVYNSSAGLTIDKCLIDYDISKNAYSWRKLTKSPTIFMVYRDDRSSTTYNDASVTYNSAETTYNGLISSEPRTFFGATDGAVYSFGVGNTYDGSDIPFFMETKDYWLGDPSLFKLLQKLIVHCDGGRHVSIQYKIDDGDWKMLGRLNRSVTELDFPSGTRGRSVKFRVTESSHGDPFTFEGFDIRYQYEGLVE